MTLKLQIVIGLGLFISGFLVCAMLNLSKSESYKIQIAQLGLVIQAVNTPRK